MANLAAAKHYLDSLDLHDICEKMCSAHYPLPRWQLGLAKTCETLYKRYLWLLVKYPEAPLAPSRDIDEFWHNHILHTKRYLQDCQAIFGRYLHHDPGDPENPEDRHQLQEAFLRTKQYYQAEFGEPLQILARV